MIRLRVPPQARRDWRRARARHRGLLVAGLLAAALALGLHVLAPPPPPTTPVPVADRDLPAGHTLAAADLQVERWPVGAAPSGLLRAPAGQVLAAPVRRGEPVTDVRVTGSRLLAGLAPGLRAVGVRVADPTTLRLVRAGDRVDVLAARADGSGEALSEVVVEAALVLVAAAGAAEDPPTGLEAGSQIGSQAGSQAGTAVVLAVDRTQARRLTAAAARAALSVTLRSPSQG